MPPPNLAANSFFDDDTFGLSWKDKYVKLGAAMSARKDNKGSPVTLPAGAIGYVASATPGTVLVVFDRDPRRVPEPTGPTNTVASQRYGVVITFGFNDWRLLRLTRTR